MTNTRCFGYIRVSSKDQNIARQMKSMREQGINERDLYVDHKSGKDFNRPQYEILRNNLREGDTLYIHSLDRFGRNKEQILKEWTYITQELKADIVVLDMPILDTRNKIPGVGSLITELVFTLLSWLAEEERVKIKTRQREGIDEALKRGQHFGRPKLSVTDKFVAAYKRWKAGEITGVEATKLSDTSKMTFYRMVKLHEGK